MGELSKNNLKCLDNCHPPKETFIHPQTKKSITNNTKNNICSVSYYIKNDKEYYTDECIISQTKLLTSLIILNNYYNIYSMDDLLTVLDSVEKPFDTKVRLFNIGFLEYFDKLVFIDNRLCDFISLICANYIDKICKETIHISENNNIDTHINYINSMYIGKAKIEFFFTDFIKNNKSIINERASEYKQRKGNTFNLALFIVDAMIKFIIKRNTSKN